MDLIDVTIDRQTNSITAGKPSLDKPMINLGKG
jgi:hypothetical protein